MAETNAAAWDQLSAWYQANTHLPTDVVHYGPDGPDEQSLRLLGDVSAKRVLDLGCGAAQNAIVLTKAGAKAIGVDSSSTQLAYGRKLAEAEELRVELHHGDLANLGMLTSASIDLALSVYALQYVEDVSRVFRQVHRVLKADAPFVLSVPHPMQQLFDPGSNEVQRGYFDRDPLFRRYAGVQLVEYRRTVSDYLTALQRANFRVELITEPEMSPRSRSSFTAELNAKVPALLIVRARKLGV
jgi:ubiquinone/menaquinone biosynthesis C-methylase UbiE